MVERLSHGLPARVEDRELSETTVYYTMKGSNGQLQESGHTTQEEPNSYTYARESGTKKQIRLDDRGDFMNPVGMYAQRAKMERWATVTDAAFASYLNFLQTKNQMFLRQAERNAI
jgi:hypothetical protein